MEKGFIKLFHKFDEWEWYDNPNVKALFIHLLLKANIETKQWQGRTIKRGQLVTSIEKLAAANGLTTQQTRTALNNMRITKEIEIETTSRYSVITVKNYNLYQANNKQITKYFKGGDNKPTPKQITTTKDNTNSNTSYINTHTLAKNVCVENQNISEEDLKILRKYAKENGAKRIKPYVAKLIENGGYIDILKEEKEKLAKQEKQKQEKKTQQTEETPINIEEDKQKIKEIQAKIRRKRNDRTN